MSSNAIDPYEDLSLETVVEPGDIVEFERPVVGESIGDKTDYTHGIVVEIVGRDTNRAPDQIGVAIYTPDEQAQPAGGKLDLETGKYTGIPAIADCTADELILVYKTGSETGYTAHNEKVTDLIEHYSNE